MISLLREFLFLGVIIPPLPNTITNGQTIDAVPVMSNFNWIVSNVNTNSFDPTAPGPIGGTTPGAGTFTAIVANVSVTGGTGTFSTLASTGNITSTTGNIVATVGSLASGSGTTGVAIGPYTGGANFAIYSTNVIASNSNFTLAGNGATNTLNGTASVNLSINNNMIVTATATGAAVTGNFSATAFRDDAGNLLISSTNPTIASGFGTGPAILANNTAAFKVTVGTGGLDSTGVITMPAAPAGWACHVLNLTDTSTAHMLRMTAMSTTSLTVTNSIIGGGNQPFGVANVLLFQCTAF
jgi:hypothetical protein